MIKNCLRTLCTVSFLVGLSGCKVGPRYQPPAVDPPGSWKEESSDIKKIEDVGCWWEIFDDPHLNELEEAAIFNNQDIQVAMARVKREWSMAGMAGGDLFPQISVNPQSFNTMGLAAPAIGGDIIVDSAVPQNNGFPIASTSNTRVHTQSYLFPFTLTYQLDLWRKIYDHFEALVFSAQSKEEALRNVILTVTSDLAQNYFQLRSYDEQLIILDQAIKVRADAVDINLDRFDAGLVSYTDYVQAKSELYSAVALKINTERMRRLTENLIAVLIGADAPDFCLPPSPLVGMPPQIPAGLPSDLLLRRPDIAEAERMMASKNDEIGSATASFFPSISLTGQYGWASPQIGQLFTGDSRYWLWGTNFMEILFDGNRLQSNLNLTYADYAESVANYKQKVLVAFREVEDALSNIQKRKLQDEALAERVEYSQLSVDLSQERYTIGLATYLEVVVELRNLLQAQIDEQQVLADQYIATVQLIKTLGGGWTTPYDEGCPVIPRADRSLNF